MTIVLPVDLPVLKEIFQKFSNIFFLFLDPLKKSRELYLSQFQSLHNGFKLETYHPANGFEGIVHVNLITS